MPELVVIQHLEREGPGLLAAEASARGWSVRICRPYAGDPLPEADRTDQLLAVMGGPMGLADLGSARFPWLEPTVALLRRRLERQLPLLGICLGAQLLAHAGGGGAVPLVLGEPPLRLREVGFGAVQFSRSEAEEPVLAGMGATALVLHWHGDRILLPPDAIRLASSLHCPEQMFRLGSRAYGLQFHIEITAADLECWLEEDDDFVRGALGGEGADRIRADAALWLEPAAVHWRRLIGNLLVTCLG